MTFKSWCQLLIYLFIYLLFIYLFFIFYLFILFYFIRLLTNIYMNQLIDFWLSLKKYVFCNGYNAPTLCRNLQKRYLVCSGRDTFHTRCPLCYASQAFHIITWQPHQLRGLPLSATWGRAGHLCGLEPWETFTTAQYTDMKIAINFLTCRTVRTQM